MALQDAFTTVGSVFTPSTRDFLSCYGEQKGTFTNTPLIKLGLTTSHTAAYSAFLKRISEFISTQKCAWMRFDYFLLYALFITASSLTLLSYLLFPKACFYSFIFCYFSIIFIWETYIHLSQYCWSIMFPVKPLWDPSEEVSHSLPCASTPLFITNVWQHFCFCNHSCAYVLFRLWARLWDWQNLNQYFGNPSTQAGMVQKLSSHKLV